VLSLRLRKTRPLSGENPETQLTLEPTNDGPPPRNRTRKFLWLLVRLAIAAALLAYLAKSGTIDRRAISRPFTAWPIALAAIALILLDISLMAQRLVWLFRPIGLNLSWSKSFQVAMVSFLFGVFLPGAVGSDISRLYYVAKDHAARRSEIVIVTLFDRGIGMLSLLLMPLLFAPFFSSTVAQLPALRDLLIISAVTSVILIAGFFACIYLEPLVQKIADATLGILPWRDWYTNVIRTVGSYRTDLGAIGLALLVSLAGNSLMLIGTVLAVMAIDPANLNLRMALVVPLGFVANCLPVTPGGLGVGEAAFNSLFAMAGLRGGADALICWRVWTAIVRLLGVVFYLRGVERVFGHHPEAGSRSESAGPTPAARP
jgi:glycosyltransferase 2 family protein